MKTTARRRARPQPARPRRHQRGIVLIIALVVMVAMALAGVALVRSIDTTTSVVGNLAFRQASILPSNLAVEHAVLALFESNVIANRENDLPAQSYFAKQQPGEDANTGVPAVLQSVAAYSAYGGRVEDAGNGNTVRYVIERMCRPDAPTPLASSEQITQYCNRVPPNQAAAGTATEQKLELPRVPLYRLTIRVDSPSNTVTFAQAMLR